MRELLRARRVLVLFVLAVAAAGCDFGSVTTTPNNPDQSNVAYSQTDLTVGTGAEAVAGSTATVAYGLWLYSDTAPDHKGTQVDANQLSFVIGVTNLIQGFVQGVTGMKVGGTRRVIVPPSLGFGSTGNGTSVPPNAALVFDLQLVNVQ